jgi:hypothetical protein
MRHGHSAPQAFVRVRIAATTDARQGRRAELMIPKWFDKSAAKRSKVDDLRAAVLAVTAYTATGARASAFGHYVRLHAGCCGRRIARRPPLVAFRRRARRRACWTRCCVAKLSFVPRSTPNLPAIDAALAPDLAGFRHRRVPARVWRCRLDRRAPHRRLARPLVGHDAAIDRRFAVTLGECHRALTAIATSSQAARQIDADIARLVAIAGVLDACPAMRVTARRQRAVVPTCRRRTRFVGATATHAGLGRLAAATLYLEQPLARERRWRAPCALASVPAADRRKRRHVLRLRRPARAVYGVSSKSCKGLYKSIVNAMRCAQWNAEHGASHYFFPAKTDDAGRPRLQQDLAMLPRSASGTSSATATLCRWLRGQGAPASEQAGHFRRASGSL